MAIVTRTFLREPSVTTCALSTRRLSIGGHSFDVNDAIDSPEGSFVVTVGGTFVTGHGANKRTVTLSEGTRIKVTGIQCDECIIKLDAAQPIEVRLTGCVLAEDDPCHGTDLNGMHHGAEETCPACAPRPMTMQVQS